MDPGVGHSRGIGRGRLEDPSCAAEAVVFMDRVRRSSQIWGSGVSELQIQCRACQGIGRDGLVDLGIWRAVGSSESESRIQVSGMLWDRVSQSRGPSRTRGVLGVLSP